MSKSKKMMKRSLALGALMAFVITGSAWAEVTQVEHSSTGKRTAGLAYTSGVNNVYSVDNNNNNITNNNDDSRNYGLALTFGNKAAEEVVLGVNIDEGVILGIDVDCADNRAQGIRVNYGNTLNVSGGTLKVDVDTTGADYSLGIGAYHKGTINASSTVVNVDGNRGHIWAIGYENDKTINLGNDKYQYGVKDSYLTINNLNASANVTEGGEVVGAKYDTNGKVTSIVDDVRGIVVSYGTLNLVGESTIVNVTNGVDGFGRVQGAMTQGDIDTKTQDFTDAIINFNASNTSFTVTNTGKNLVSGVQGIVASGPVGINFNGQDASITVNGGTEATVGLRAQHSSNVTSVEKNNLTITANSKTEKDVIGIAASEYHNVGKFNLNGKTTVAVTNDGTGRAIGVHGEAGAYVGLANANIVSSTKGAGSAYGVNLENKSTATLGETTITSTSSGGNGFGFRLASGKETKDGVTTYSGNTVTVSGDATITANGANYAQGIYSQYSDVTFNKDTSKDTDTNVNITATSTGDYAYAVRMLGDKNSGSNEFTNSKITFNNDLTKLNAKSYKYAWGVVASGGNDGCGAYFNGKKVEIDVEAGEQAVGVNAQYGAGAIASSADTSIIIGSNATNGSAYGIATDLYYGEVAGAVDFKGNVTVNAEGNSAYGVEALNGAGVSLGSAGKAVSITATGTGSDGEAIAVYVENANSEVNITANTVTVNATSKNANKPGSSLQAKDGGVVNVVAGTANIDGMMYAEGQGSRINVTANTAANIKGDIFTENNGVVVLKLNGTNASYTGATNIESVSVEENADVTGPVFPDADKGATLVLEKGATWYVTGNSTVSGIIGDKFNVKAAEGVKGAVVTIDGHLPDDIDDDYDDTVSTITGVGLVINEDGDGLGGNVTLDSDSDITVNATERGIYAEKDTHVNIKAATLTLNNKEGYDAINANGEVNIDAANLVFNGKVVADGEGSVVNITTGDFAYDVNKQFATENNGVINIAGGNISGELKVIGGNVNLIAGNVTSTLNIAKGSTVSLTGATIETKDLASVFSEGNEGKLIIDSTGVLKTIADQVFTVAEDTKATTGLEGNKVIDDKVTYKAGTVSLSDDYSYEYLTSINDAIKAYKYDGNNASTTKLVMTGNLVTKAEDIKPEESITIDQASNLGNNVELDNVTVEAEKNLLIGANVAEDGSVKVETSDGSHIEVEDSVENGFSANQLDLGEGSTGAVITGGQEIVLGGSQNDTSKGAHEVVTVDGKKQEVIIVVGTKHEVPGVKDTKGTLKIGNSAAKETDKYQLTGKAVINKDSELHTKGETTITEGVELKDGGKVHVDKDAHLKANIKAKGKDNVITGKVTGDLEVEVDEVHPSTVIHLGNDKKAGKMNAEHSKLKGGTLFLDPAYAKGIDEGSAFALGNASTLDGAYIAGQNSTISFGVNSTDVAEEVFAKTGLTFGNEGDVDAVVYIDGTTDVAVGSITANGALTSASSVVDGTVAFAANSLLMVEAEDVNGNTAAITGASKVTVDANAKLYIDDAVKGATYKIIDGKDNGWKAENILTNNQLIKFTDNNDNDNKLDLVADVKNVNEVYGKDVIIDKVIDEALDSGADSSDNFNSAVDGKVNVDKAAQVDALNSIGAMNEVAGVTHTTYAVSNILTDAVADHMSLANGKDHDKDIWAHYVHTKENVDGLKRAGAYDAQYNGIVVGTDLYKEGKATVGAALTYVDGNINGSSVAARTENDAKYYGASIYGSIQNDDTAVIADVSYLHGEHDITQRNSGKVITGEPESDAFSVGVRVEKEAKAGIGKLVPYAGLRYMHLGTGNYTNSIGLAYNADDAELFLLPVGLKYSADIKNTNGWTMRPVVEFGYVWAFGDTDADQTVSLNGASNGFGYDVTDSGSYVGRFMLEAEKANISYALGYEYQKGDNVEADKWMVNVNWKF